MGCGHSKAPDKHTAKVASKPSRPIQDLDSRKLQKIARAIGKYFDPEALLESIANGSIALVRGRWVVAHFEAGGKLMRRQDLPPEAFFTVDELRKLVAALGDDWGLLFVAISYRWLTAIHPDPDAFHLNIVAKVAKLYLKSEKDMGMFSCSLLVDAFERLNADPWDAELTELSAAEPREVRPREQSMPHQPRWQMHMRPKQWP